MQRIYHAQNELSAATHLTSKLLREYDTQRFPLGGDDEVMSSTLQQFAKVIDELSSSHAVLSTQLADAMMFPITQFKERDLKEILTLKEVFQIASDDHDMANNRYSRLSKKRDNERVKAEVIEDVYTARKKQHQTMMHYFSSLNALQYKKKISLLEPLLGYMQAQISFFKLGSENLTQQWEDFLATIGTSVQNVRREMETEVGSMQQTIQEMEDSCDLLYVPCDPDPAHTPLNRNLTRKQGYLYTRNKTGLVSSSWERQYFFTQGGNLMVQGRGEVAGGLLMDIDNCSVMAVDSDDRRFCFQITSFDGKKVATLQAENRGDCEEWISTINNISKRIYLSENAEVRSLYINISIMLSDCYWLMKHDFLLAVLWQELAARVNQSALEAVTPSPSFQQRHESMKPAGGIIPVRGARGVRAASALWDQRSLPALSALSFDALVAPETPIQFDIISPVSEGDVAQTRTPTHGRRSNPFGESGEITEEENQGLSVYQSVYLSVCLYSLFVVRFLGSMEVHSGEQGHVTGEQGHVIGETMRQILAARAIHNVFRMTESHLLVTCSCLKLIDPQTQVTRLRFPLQSVLQSASHQDNKRLLGFVLDSPDTHGSRTVCYIFESNNDGEKICDSIGLAKQIAFHSDLDRKEARKRKEQDKEQEKKEEELSKQRQIEKDLEEQSRLIAASSRPANPPSSDGQFLVLSNSQSEDSDAGDEGKKLGETLQINKCPKQLKDKYASISDGAGCLRGPILPVGPATQEHRAPGRELHPPQFQPHSQSQLLVASTAPLTRQLHAFLAPFVQHLHGAAQVPARDPDLRPQPQHLGCELRGRLIAGGGELRQQAVKTRDQLDVAAHSQGQHDGPEAQLPGTATCAL
ncbi:DCC-interacting protein 13-alpha [Merluccius polli]|uniref:DCC-interacting protein 13-alpha n=1 Tax=Merluccius polli TaxID=89951 RepID=A0AA47M936_MERPO|nr:DCC-interacting protein 13-alpha [Merluccius polli]